MLGGAAGQDDSGEVMRSLEEIRRLPRAKQEARSKVEIEGIFITPFKGVPPDLQIYQNGTSLYVVTGWAKARGVDIEPWAQLRPGDRVRLRGHVLPGRFAPTLDPDSIERLGEGSLPEPREVLASELGSGQLDGQWITITGVVQSVKELDRKTHWICEMGSAHGKFNAKIVGTNPASLTGSQIRIKGVALPYFNFRGQMLGLMVLIPFTDWITVLRPADADPFKVPEITFRTMRDFDPEEGTDSGRRRLKGVVTFVEPDSYLFLQADNLGIKVGLIPGQTAAVEDEVEAAGFVVMNGSFAGLEHAFIRRLGTAPLPSPALLTSEGKTLSSVLDPQFYYSVPPPPDVHCRLVSLQGKLLKVDSLRRDRPTLWIEPPGDSALTIPVTVSGELIPPRLGSIVEMRGICELIMPEQPAPDSILGPEGLKIHLASPQDLTVIQAAPWWTPARQWMLIGGIAAVLGLTLLQVRALRHRIRVGAAALSELIVHRRADEARAEERQRLAEEVHDIMAQSLTGVSLQIKAADMTRISAPAEVPRHLKLASGLLDFARDEIRRTVFDLRSGLLDDGDLSTALKGTAEMFALSGACEVDWNITGAGARIHPLAAHSLVRIIQEGLTNSQKHGRATRVEIQLDCSPRAIHLVIRDNGVGSAASDRPGPADGHFGLEGMRGRARRLGGEFKFTSTPGHGTTVEAHIPLIPAAATTPLNPGSRPPVIPPEALTPKR